MNTQFRVLKNLKLWNISIHEWTNELISYVSYVINRNMLFVCIDSKRTLVFADEVFFKIFPFKVLKHFTFNVQPNQTVALVGSSGSGKSTIINILQRFYPLHEGNVRLLISQVVNFHSFKQYLTQIWKKSLIVVTVNMSWNGAKKSKHEAGKSNNNLLNLRGCIKNFVIFRIVQTNCGNTQNQYNNKFKFSDIFHMKQSIWKKLQFTKLQKSKIL